MNSTETNNSALDSTSLIEALAEDYQCLFHVELNSLHEDHYRIGKDFAMAKAVLFDKDYLYLIA